MNYIFIFISLYFEVFLLMSLMEDSDETKNDNDYFPYVDIIVPVFNEEKTIAKTLNSLLALDYPKEKYNIFAINDGSTDGTLEALKKFEDKENIVVLSKENGGKHSRPCWPYFPAPRLPTWQTMFIARHQLPAWQS